MKMNSIMWCFVCGVMLLVYSCGFFPMQQWVRFYIALSFFLSVTLCCSKKNDSGCYCIGIPVTLTKGTCIFTGKFVTMLMIQRWCTLVAGITWQYCYFFFFFVGTKQVSSSWDTILYLGIWLAVTQSLGSILYKSILLCNMPDES